MSDAITPEMFAHLVDLAALELSPEEAEYLRRQLNNQLKAIHELEAIPLDETCRSPRTACPIPPRSARPRARTSGSPTPTPMQSWPRPRSSRTATSSSPISPTPPWNNPWNSVTFLLSNWPHLLRQRKVSAVKFSNRPWSALRRWTDARARWTPAS